MAFSNVFYGPRSDWKSAYRKSRKEEKILSRLRTDSCFFRIQNFLDPIKYNKDYCNLCNLYTTVDHILCKCPRFQRYRLRMISDLDINPLDLTEAHILNDDFNHDKLFKYLKDIDYYNRIWFSLLVSLLCQSSPPASFQSGKCKLASHSNSRPVCFGC